MSTLVHQLSRDLLVYKSGWDQEFHCRAGGQLHDFEVSSEPKGSGRGGACGLDVPYVGRQDQPGHDQQVRLPPCCPATVRRLTLPVSSTEV